MQPELLTPRPHRNHLERVLALRSFSELSHLAPEQLAAIAENAEERHFSAGEEIYREGEPVAELHYVIEGEVEVKRRGITVSVHGQRSVIGGLAVLASVDDGHQAVATVETSTLAVKKEDQTEIFEDNFDLLLAVIRAVAATAVEARLEAGPSAGFGAPGSEVRQGDDRPRNLLTLVDRLAVLRRSVPFARGRLEVTAELAREAREVRHPRGTCLWQVGDPSQTALILVSGTIAAKTGRDQAFSFGPGDIVGGVGALAGRGRWYEARCESEVCAVEIDVEVLLDLFEDHVDMAMSVLSVIADGILMLREQRAGAATPAS